MIHHNSFKKPVSGIILSGGFSNRFQQKGITWQDKALQPIQEDESLLEHTIKTLAEFCSEIIIMSSNYSQQLQYQTIIQKLPTNYQKLTRVEIDDLNLICSGPSRGLLSATNYLNNQYAVIVPVDVPFVYSRIFLDLLNNLNESSICVPFWPSGKIEPLIFAFNVKKLQNIVPLLAFNEYSRADDIFRLTSSINLLQINEQKQTLAEKIFKSINNQQEYKQVKKYSIEKSKSLFDLREIVRIDEVKYNESNSELLNFFNNTNFIKMNESILHEGLKFSKTLSDKSYNYKAGYILAFLLRLIKQDKEKTKTKLFEEIVGACSNYFLLEAKNWERHNVKFLALHAYLDAYSISKLNKPNDQQKQLHEIIARLRKELQLKEKQHNDLSFSSMFTKKLPGFIDKAKQVIREAESAYNEQNSQYDTDFLWDHSYRVGRIAYYLAIHEGIDPFIPTIAAILHDAGKFVLGQYHADEVSEEEHSSNIAENILGEEGLSKQEIIDVQKAISGLYTDQIPCNIACQIVYDADRLDKLGVFGIANYFTKMTLRGSNLSNSIIRSLSRELTYATSASKTMLTKTGKLLAEKRTAETLQYFKELLMELQFYGLGKYYIKDFFIKDKQSIQLIIPEKCSSCSGKYVISLNTKAGLKCEKVIAQFDCTNCDNNYSIEFCLPLIVNHKK